MEEPSFINFQNKQLFSMLYSAKANPVNKVTVVFCDPIFEEKLWAQRVMVNLARYLSTKDLLCVRFDYTGLCESSGYFKNNTLETYIEDINDICNYVSKKYEPKKLLLLGLRFGAFVSLEIVKKRKDIDGLLLLEPVLDTQEYIMQCLRSNLTSQLVLYKKVKYTREVLFQQLQDGNIINVDGYELTHDFYNSIKNNEHSFIPPKDFRVLLTRVVRNAKAPVNKTLQAYLDKCILKNVNIEFETVMAEPFWSEVRKINTAPSDLFEKVEAWLLKNWKNV